MLYLQHIQSSVRRKGGRGSKAEEALTSLGIVLAIVLGVGLGNFGRVLGRERIVPESLYGTAIITTLLNVLPFGLGVNGIICLAL